MVLESVHNEVVGVEECQDKHACVRTCEVEVTDVVRADGVHAIHEDLGAVLVKRALAISDEGNVFYDNLVVDFILTFWVKNFVALDCVIKDSCL